MKKIYAALGTASLLALSACGGGGGSEANNTAATENLTLPADSGVETLPPEDFGNGSGTIDTTNGVDANLTTDANLTAGNTSADATGNLTNSQ